MNTNVVELSNITKKFKNAYALKQVSLTIPKGSIFGLIGQNGAGKSTLMKIICGMMHQSEGTLRLFGSEPSEDEYVYRRVGSLIENVGYFSGLSAYENMKVKALGMGCYDDHTIRDLLAKCGLASTGKKKVKNFSLGMKQRLGIAFSLLGKPELLVLDEPVNGLDPQGIHEVRSLLMKLNKEEQMTILISSHMLTELSKIASDYAIIKDGELVEQLQRAELEEKCKDSLRIQMEPLEQGLVILEQECKITQYEVLHNQVVEIFDQDYDASRIAKALVQQDIRLYRLSEYKQDLESYFLKRVGDEDVE